MFQRKLSSYEKFLFLSSVKNSFNISILIKFKTLIDLKQLKLAFKILQKRHPLLKICIKNNIDTFFSSKNVKSIPIKIIQKKCDVKKLLTNELHTPFLIEKGPLARAVFIQNKKKYLILTFHHLIIDGIGANLLINELFTILDDLVDGKKIDKTSRKEEKKSLEELIKIKNRYKIKLNLNTKLKSSVTTEFFFHHFSQKISKKIHQICHKKRLSVLSVLFASYLFAMKNKIQAGKKKYKNIKIQFHTPINLRPIFNLGPKELGCLIAMPFFDISIDSKTTIWSLSKEVFSKTHAVLNKHFLKQLFFYTEKFLYYNSSYKDLKKVFIWKNSFLGISNLGTSPVSKHFKHSTIENMHFLVAMHGNFRSCNNLFVIIWTFNNSLYSTILYPKPLLSKNQAKKIQKEVIDTLKKLTD